jgi:hypothetical protein
MITIKTVTKPLFWFMALLVVALTAGCGGASDPILGGGGAGSTSSKAITAYSLAGSAGVIDEVAMTIAVTVPYGTPVTSMVATYITTGASVNVGATAQASGTTANNFTNPVVYTVTAGDATTASYTVTVTVASFGAKAITAYSVVGVAGTINETAKTIAVTVPSGTNVTALVATYTTTGTGVTVGVATQTSGTTANDFTAAVAYVVTAGDASTATYTVTVTVAAASAKAITAYAFAGYAGAPGVIDEAAKTIAVTLPFGSNVTALVAQFTSTGTGVPKVAGVNQVSGVTANNFLTSKAYTVTAADASTAVYTVTVTVASASPKAITAYSLPVGATNVAGTINEGAKTIAVILPSGTVVTNLVATFTTTGTGGVTVAAVTQVSGTTANDFTNPVAYKVTAADASTATYTVTVSFAVANPTAPTLGEAGRFVILANQAITTTGTTAIRNGDIGITPAARSFMTGFTPGAAGDFTELTGLTWAGMASTSYAPADANPAPFPYPLHYALPHAVWTTTGAMLTQANTDQGIAFTFLTADPNPTAPTQVCPSQLGGQTLVRGVYKSPTNVSITTGTLYLDAQGDPNAVFIFSIAGTLTTGAPGGSIVLMNGALAKNVFWATGGTTVIGAGTIFYGSVFAWTQINVLAGAQITGSLFGITDRVTLIADTVTKAP